MTTRVLGEGISKRPERKKDEGLTLNAARPEGEFIFFSDTSHRTVTEFAGPSSDATIVAIAASGGARDVDIGSGNLQLDIRDEELALGTLLQDGDFLLLDDGGNGSRQRAGHRENR